MANCAKEHVPSMVLWSHLILFGKKALWYQKWIKIGTEDSSRETKKPGTLPWRSTCGSSQGASRSHNRAKSAPRNTHEIKHDANSNYNQKKKQCDGVGHAPEKTRGDTLETWKIVLAHTRGAKRASRNAQDIRNNANSITKKKSIWRRRLCTKKD